MDSRALGEVGRLDTTVKGVPDPILGIVHFFTHMDCAAYAGIEKSVAVLFNVRKSQLVPLVDDKRGSISIWQGGHLPNLATNSQNGRASLCD